MPFQLLARSTAPMAGTKPIEPGTTLEIIVQGVNGGSQGVASDPIFFTVPLATPAPTARTQSEPAVAASTNGTGNGHSNGAEHTNGSRSAARV
jgi:hypothetical protein